MQCKVAVLGDTDFVAPFSALGLDGFAVGEAAESVLEKARQILEAGYVLVVVAENVAPAAQQAFSAVQDRPVPCVIVVPFTTASTAFALQKLGATLKTAMGINILQDS
jgi:vacuolar-type H+-ATPase subunit F/Vma7